MKSHFTILLTLFIIPSVFGQTLISGAVKDVKGQPVIGANVYLKDTYDGSSTDVNGKFSFKTEQTGEQILVVTFVGYIPFEKPVELKSDNEEFVQVKLNEAINKLNAVVISAGTFSAGEESSREVLESIDIVTTAGATADVAGALNTLPGTQTVGEQGRLFVRGGDGYETRTFIDGLEVLDSYSPSAPQTATRGRFSPFMFDGTSFSTGGYSAEYGQALSSALILKTKDVAVQDRTDISIMTVGADVAHSQTFNNSSLSAKVQYTNLTPYFEMVSQKINYEKAPTSYESNFAYRKKIKDDGILKVYGNLNQTSLEIYESKILYPNEEDRIGLSNIYGYLNTNYSSIISDKWSHSSGISYTNSTDELIFNDLVIDEQLQGIHAKTVFFYDPSSKLSLKTGIESFTHRSVFNLGQQDINLEYSKNLSASFVEADYYLSNALVFRSGLRFEFDDLQRESTLSPRLSFAYKVSEKGQLSLAYGTFRQSPQAQFLRVNNNLESEAANHYIINYQYNGDGRTFRAEAYYKGYNNLVKYQNEFDSNSFSNDGIGFAKGFDLFWRDNKSIENLDYWVSYSYLDTERNYLDYPGISKPSFSSTHNFSLVTKYFITDIKTQVGTTYSYSSSRPFNNPNTTEFNAERTPAYHDLSMNFSYLFKRNVIIHASVTNVLGIDNVFGYEWSDQKNANNEFVGRPVKLPAPRFIFLGVFITLSKNKSINQLPNL